MSSLSLSAIFWSTMVIQLLGLGSLVAARVCRTSWGRAMCQQFFVMMLAALGLITVLAVGADSDSWVTSGATLSIMTVCATVDFRGDRPRSAAY
ncbi:MAG: hypothetical protein R6U98_04555 [Pirellulaceae bacterium]